jgi:outer membrane lipoprotein
MKKMLFIAMAALLLGACSPVLSRELMRQGKRDVAFNQLRQTPDDYKGRLFILGGVISDIRLSDQGSQIEALYVPVDSYGYLKEWDHAQGRFLAIYPRSKGLLDPVVFKNGREITLAGEFVEIWKGKIDEMEYAFPVFEIKQIYLWQEEKYYAYPPYYYPYYYNAPFLYDPWGRPYPNPYWPMYP